jgi:hypothetical protein|tara:strand:+ start:4201 stop:4407 length:207 start_codon:yes stop_codon:yes gene_type:complete
VYKKNKEKELLMTRDQWEKLEGLIENPNKSGFKYTDEIVITRDSQSKGAWNIEIRSIPLPNDWEDGNG